MKKAMKIEIWSDIMCPFCYIGKRRLEAALAEFEHKEEVEVVWKSFLLNPDMATDPSKNISQYLAEVKGWSLEQAKEINAHVTEMAEEEGLHYDFDKAVVANAKDAHRLLQYAKRVRKGGLLKERLLKAYFTEGVNIADHDALMKLAEEVGLDPVDAGQVLASGEFADAVNRDITESQQLGVRGVPFFVIDRKYGISGAQPKEVFVDTLNKAWEENHAQSEKVEVGSSGADGDHCDVKGNC